MNGTTTLYRKQRESPHSLGGHSFVRFGDSGASIHYLRWPCVPMLFDTGCGQAALPSQIPSISQHSSSLPVIQPPFHVFETLFLPRLDCISILTSDDLDFRRAYHLVTLHFERRVLNDKCPHVVAQAIGVQVAL